MTKTVRDLIGGIKYDPLILTMVFFIFGVVAGVTLPIKFIPVENGLAHVIRVIDGDTIVVLHKEKEERIRFLGINAPERNEIGYEEAKEQLSLLLPSQVKLVSEPGRELERDSFCRLLAYVHRLDGTDIGEDLIRRNLVKVNMKYPCSRTERYIRLKEGLNSENISKSR